MAGSIVAAAAIALAYLASRGTEDEDSGEPGPRSSVGLKQSTSSVVSSGNTSSSSSSMIWLFRAPAIIISPEATLLALLRMRLGVPGPAPESICVELSVGPLNVARFLRAKMGPDEGEGMSAGAASLKALVRLLFGPPLTSRMLLGKADMEVGVAGRILMEEWGERPRALAEEPVGVETVSMLLEDIEDVFEWE